MAEFIAQDMQVRRRCAGDSDAEDGIEWYGRSRDFRWYTVLAVFRHLGDDWLVIWDPDDGELLTQPSRRYTVTLPEQKWDLERMRAAATDAGIAPPTSAVITADAATATELMRNEDHKAACVICRWHEDPIQALRRDIRDEAAERRYANGHRQHQCGGCGGWYWLDDAINQPKGHA